MSEKRNVLSDDPVVLKKKQSVIDVGQRTQLDLLQAEIRRNKETLTNLRLENTQLHLSIKRATRGQQRFGGDEYFRREEEQLHNRLCLLKRSLNSVRGKKDELVREIERTVEETAFTLKEGDATIDEGSAVGQKIRSLENRLDKCLIKHNEVNAIRRTYETLLERLQQEQAGFDTQLAAMEKTLQNKEKDLADLNSLANDAANGRDRAKAEVLQLKTQISKERRAQKKDIEERRAFVDSKRELLEKRSRRLQEKIEKGEERRLHARMALGSSHKKKIRVTAQKQLQPEDVEWEQCQREAYNRLKETTMSSNVAEVVFKLKERQSANEQLQLTLNEAKEMDLVLKEERAKLQQEWDELQQQNGGTPRALTQQQQQSVPGVGKEEFNSTGGSAQERGGLSVPNTAEQRALVRRRVLEEFESHLTDRKNELSETLRLQDALGQMLVDVDAGVHHLAEKLGINRDVISSASLLMRSSVESLSLPAHPTCSARGKVVVDLLQNCREKLRRMMEVMGDGDVDAAAKYMARWRGALSDVNIRVRPDRSALRDKNNVDDNDVDNNDDSDAGGVRFASISFERERGMSEGAELVVGSRKWLGAAAARTAPADDFPENEIHDRQELKMMSIATVERERKKAKKLLQQRSREETS